MVLFPDTETGDCFSGSAFIDRENQLGLKTGDEEVIMAFYLRTKTGLCLAYSNDRGQTMTWHNMPDDRLVQITWMKGPPDHMQMPFNQQMTLPSELTLHSTEAGPRIHMNPVREIGILRTKTYKWENIVLNKTNNPLTALDGELYEIEVELSPGRESQTIFSLRDVKVIYDAAKEKITCNEIHSRLKPENGVVRLRIFVDRTSVEVYANGGVAYLPLVYMMSPENKNYSATTTGGEVKVKTLHVHELSSIWSNK